MTIATYIAMPVLAVMQVSAAIAQDEKLKAFNLHGQVFELNLDDSIERPIVGAVIEIWSGEEFITSIESGSKGKYKINLVYYPIYHLKFGKSPYITKVIEINAKGFTRAAEFGVVNLDLDVSIFKDQNFLGLGFMSYTPVAKASFNKSKGVILWDDKYSKQMNGRIQGVLEANGK
ncbi:MAG: hypothetical protein ACKVOK_08240 [Flavobacteriales bacterium]